MPYPEDLSLAVVAAYKKAQEISYRYCKGTVKKGGIPWYSVPFWKGLNKSIVKSIWRKHHPKGKSLKFEPLLS